MAKNILVLHERALKAAEDYRKTEKILITVLQEIDDLRGYRDLGYRSLHDYVTQSLGLGDQTAYILISLGRKSREVPELGRKIESNEISITNARMIAPILTQANQTQWLEKAQSLSKRELEKEVKRAFPESAVQERARYVAYERMELKLGIDETLHEKLKRAQDLLSQRKGEAASLEETLNMMTEFFLERNDPVIKAERISVRKTVKSGPVISTTSEKKLYPDIKKRERIDAATFRAVMVRDRGQCTEIKNGQRCRERRWLDVHHIKPVAEGGTNAVENLRLLCRGHHQLEHHKERGSPVETPLPPE